MSEQQQECVFCKIADGDLEPPGWLFETDDFMCFYSTHAVSEGHALVVPKEHARYLEDFDGEGLYETLEEAHEYVLDEHDPDATNVGLNNGEAAGQTVPHLHWHIIPRYEGDMENPEGGVRGVIPEERTYRDE